MNPKNSYKLKTDKYSRARGGTSKFILISCNNCHYPLLLYQKDGPGPLKRMYIDRIHAPENLATLKDTVSSKSELQKLICQNCDKILALPMIYKPENRLALRLVRGTVKITQRKGVFPPSTE